MIELICFILFIGGAYKLGEYSVKPNPIPPSFNAQLMRRLTNLENEVSKLHRKLNGKV